MAYIRSNEDYYMSQGCTPSEAKLKDALDRANIDHGYCNPIKAKLAAEEEAEIKKQHEGDSNG